MSLLNNMYKKANVKSNKSNKKKNYYAYFLIPFSLVKNSLERQFSSFLFMHFLAKNKFHGVKYFWDLN